MKYHVEEIVCDYGIYEGDELIVILNSRSIADCVCYLLNEDERMHRIFNDLLK